jgi:hypothetical protein
MPPLRRTRGALPVFGVAMCSTNWKRPVLEDQPVHATEFGDAVRDQPEPETAVISLSPRLRA